MNSLFILIPIALVLLAIAISVFIWSVKSGQFEDLNTEGKRILFDDDKPVNSSKSDSAKEGTEQLKHKNESSDD